MGQSKEKREKLLSQAVRHFWFTRKLQAEKQIASGQLDHGARSAVTGGAQMDGFISLLTEIIIESGLDEKYIFRKKKLELPGFFRPTKEWDLLVVKDGQMILAIETKSQVGPSFGNNFNNRTEEAMGSAMDLWTAFREGAFGKASRPWLGYLILLEDCPASRSPVKVKEPHFKVFPEFIEASYEKRYELFCSKLILERHYNAAAFLTSDKKLGLKGRFSEPSADLGFDLFYRSLAAHVSSFAKSE